MNALPSLRSVRAEPPAPFAATAAFEHLEHAQFVFMREAFRAHGGLVNTDAAVECLRGACDQPISRLARWIVGGEIVIVSWQQQTWVPLFQLQARAAAIEPACADAITELREAFSDWEIALWFATPNDRLSGATPVARRRDDPAEVCRAARLDRLVAAG